VVGGFYSQESNYTLLDTTIVPTLGLQTQENHYEKHDTTLAFYAQGTYSLTDLTGVQGLGVTLGARYTNEKDSNQILPGDVSYTPANLANPLFGFYQSKISRNVGWTIGLQEQLNSDLLLYAVSRRSFKDAGYNGLNAPLIGNASENGGNGYKTETVTDGEIGAKYSGRLYDMPTRLNLAAYIDDDKDAQHVAYTIGAGGAPAAITVNVPRARTRGFEADGQIKPIGWLTLGGSLNYIDSVFTSDVVRGVVFGPVPDTPRWSETAYSQVDFPITDEVSGFIGGNVYSQSSIYITSTGLTNSGGRLFGYSVTNFQLGLTDDRRGLSLTANIKNAFNRVYYVGGIAPAELFQFNSVIPGEPRTFLIEGRVKF
jgi:iron complex outermembrane receptor protein